MNRIADACIPFDGLKSENVTHSNGLGLISLAGFVEIAREDRGTQQRPQLRVGQPITPAQFESLSEAQPARLVSKEYREFFPGKDFCANGCFYLHDDTA